jgi:hypothetical protein
MSEKNKKKERRQKKYMKKGTMKNKKKRERRPTLENLNVFRKDKEGLLQWAQNKKF